MPTQLLHLLIHVPLSVDVLKLYSDFHYAEVVEYAIMIGIDPVKESHLMYIAKEGINAPLPKDWKPCQDTNGMVFTLHIAYLVVIIIN